MIVRNFLIFIVFTLLFSCGMSKNTEIARYDKGSITVEDFYHYYNKLSDKQLEAFDDRADYINFVRKIALEKMIYQNAIEKGYDENEELISYQNQRDKSFAFDLIQKKYIDDKIQINPSDYEPYTDEYELYQIVKKTDTLDEKKLTKSYNLLNSLKNEIKNLDDFKEKASEFSDDVTAERGGFVGYIRKGYMDSKIDEVLSKISKGEVSDVIETYAGYHLIFVNSIEKYEIEDIMDNQEITDQIFMTKKNAMEEKWYKQLLKSNDLTIYYDAIDNNEFENGNPIIIYKDSIITKIEFTDQIETYRQDMFPEPTSKEKKDLLERMALRMILDEMTNSNEITKSEKYIKNHKEQFKYLLVNQYINDHISLNKITENDIKNYYDKNIDTMFTFPQKDGSDYIQPLNEVKKLISQKLEQSNYQKARSDLYISIINEKNYTIVDKNFDKLISSL